MLEKIIPLILGIFSGTITGLTPGLHINLIATTLTTTPLTNIPTTTLIIYIVSLAITHTFIDFIPSIYLGAASEDTCISILPGHEYLLQGNGQKAIQLTIIGSTIAILSLIIIIPTLFIIIKTTYSLIEKMMGWILTIIIIFLLSQKAESKRWTLIIFFISGLLGIITFNSNINQPLLPLLTGLFGASTLINSINTTSKVPKQKESKIKLNKKELLKPTILTLLISPLCSLLPGLGSSQAATISSKTTKKISTREFLILLGSINTLIIATSFTILYLTNRTRTGAASAISQITTLTSSQLLIIIIVIVITTPIAIIITLQTSKKIAKHIHKINYKYISISVLLSLTIIIFLLTNIQGILIYTTATILGLLTIKTNTVKSHLMGAILIPTTLYYLPI